MVYSDWVLLKNLHIPPLSSHSAIFSLTEADEKIFLILNHLLLLFKHYVYVSSSSKVISFETLMKSIMKVYRLEKTLSQSDEIKRKLWTEIWKTILQNLWNIKKICHSFNPLQPAVGFLYPWKNQKTFMFSDVFMGYRKATAGYNELKSVVLQIYIYYSSIQNSVTYLGWSFLL